MFMCLKRSTWFDAQVHKGLCESEQVFFEASSFNTGLVGDCDFRTSLPKVLRVLIEMFNFSNNVVFTLEYFSLYFFYGRNRHNF